MDVSLTLYRHFSQDPFDSTNQSNLSIDSLQSGQVNPDQLKW